METGHFFPHPRGPCGLLRHRILSLGWAKRISSSKMGQLRIKGRMFLNYFCITEKPEFQTENLKKKPTLIRYENKIENCIPHTSELVCFVIFRHLFLHYLGPFGICSSDCFLNRGLVSLWPGPPVDRLHFD